MNVDLFFPSTEITHTFYFSIGWAQSLSYSTEWMHIFSQYWMNADLLPQYLMNAYFFPVPDERRFFPSTRIARRCYIVQDHHKISFRYSMRIWTRYLGLVLCSMELCRLPFVEVVGVLYKLEFVGFSLWLTYSEYQVVEDASNQCFCRKKHMNLLC